MRVFDALRYFIMHCLQNNNSHISGQSQQQWMPKIYEMWPGANRFFCGCCVAGPSKDWPGMSYIWCMIISVYVPYGIIILPENWNVAPILPIMPFISLLLMVFFLFLTACSDPGIIPRLPFLLRNRQKYQKYITKDPGVAALINPVSQHESHTALPQPPPDLKYCQTCSIIRPNKASHCSSCQNCVQVFDHHCGFVGTCIGRRNYRYFILFLACLLGSVVLLLSNLIVFIMRKVGGSESVSTTAITVIFSIVIAVLGLPLLLFFIFHIYIAISHRTTREVIKGIAQQQQEQQNMWCNVKQGLIDFWEDIGQQQYTKLNQMINPPLLHP